MKKQVEILVLLDTFFLELPDSKDHIHHAPLLTEVTLALRHNIIQYVLGDPVQHDTGQYLACNAEGADPAWLSQDERSSLFLYKWMMLASLRSRGSWPLTQNTWNILVRWVIRVSPPALNTSAVFHLVLEPCLFAAVDGCINLCVLGGASSSGIMGRCWMDSSPSLVTSEVRLSRVLKWRVHYWSDTPWWRGNSSQMDEGPEIKSARPAGFSASMVILYLDVSPNVGVASFCFFGGEKPSLFLCCLRGWEVVFTSEFLPGKRKKDLAPLHSLTKIQSITDVLER